MRHLQTFRFIEAVMRAGSIRKAADDMNITASALNRRIQRFEEDFGYEIFERLPRGVRLNPAGELLMQHYRTQESDIRRVAQPGRGSFGRAARPGDDCLQPGVDPLLSAQGNCALSGKPPRRHLRSERARQGGCRARSQCLRQRSGIGFEPIHMVDFEVLAESKQVIHAIMSETHPLAGQDELRLRDCLEYPHILPTMSYGVRALLEIAVKRLSRPLNPMVESDSFDFMRHYVENENVIAFQIPIGLNPEAARGTIFKPLSTRDIPAGSLLLGQMRGARYPSPPPNSRRHWRKAWKFNSPERCKKFTGSAKF